MFNFSALRRVAFASMSAIALLASTNASAALMTFSSEAAFLAAIPGSTDSAMRFEGVAAPGSFTNQSSHTEDSITIGGIAHIIADDFSGNTLYDIGTGDSAQTRNGATSTVTHADGDMYAYGVTFYTVRGNATHASTTVDFFLDGAAAPVASIVTPAPQGTSVFFGVISDVPFASVSMFAQQQPGAPDPRRYLQTDNILVHTSPVSEPGIAALALAGLICVGLGRRRAA